MNQNHHNKPRKVLVVDDDPIIRDMMVDILDFEGYAISTARHGLEALEILRGDEDYLDFLDVMRRVLDGQEVCAVLQAEPELRNRPGLVVMRAKDKLPDDSCLINFGDAIMPKP